MIANRTSFAHNSNVQELDRNQGGATAISKRICRLPSVREISQFNNSSVEMDAERYIQPPEMDGKIKVEHGGCSTGPAYLLDACWAKILSFSAWRLPTTPADLKTTAV